MREQPQADDVTGTPTHCPTCHSPDVSTASKVANAASYWRCAACGEVWNVGRRREAARYVPAHGIYR